MLDLNLIKENTQYVVDALKKKGWDVDFTETLSLMEKRKELILKTETLKAEKNKLSATVPQVKKAGGDVQEIFAKVKEINAAGSVDAATVTINGENQLFDYPCTGDREHTRG